MKKVLLIGSVILCSLLTGCSELQDKTELHSNVFNDLPTGYDEYILIDKETGVQYILIANGHRMGLSVRLDAKGKPMIGRYVRK